MFDIGTTLTASFNNAFYGVVNFIPKFLVGLVVLVIGIIIAPYLNKLSLELLKRSKSTFILKSTEFREQKRDTPG